MKGIALQKYTEVKIIRDAQYHSTLSLIFDLHRFVFCLSLSKIVLWAMSPPTFVTSQQLADLLQPAAAYSRPYATDTARPRSKQLNNRNLPRYKVAPVTTAVGKIRRNSAA